MEHFDYCIIGAGVVGLAVAYKLSQTAKNASILLIEKHPHFGSETSSRNSEVIHAGIYYPANSLKAALCTQGKNQLYDFCQQYAVPHRALGKLIVAHSPQELPALEQLQQKAASNGVLLEFLDQKACYQKEPSVNAHAALLSATTGIIDSHSYMQTLLTLAQQNDVLYSPNTQFLQATETANRFVVSLGTGDGIYKLACNNIINCAGLHATTVASNIDSLAAVHIPQHYYCKGHYFGYQGQSPFSHLIYPLPNKNTSGLGIHATLDLAGQLRFGPDTQYIDDIDYTIGLAANSSEGILKQRFSQSIKRYFPSLQAEKLHYSYSGIRPKLSSENQAAKDFVIQDCNQHQVKGLINLFGIESPGLTASLAIADYVIERI